MNHLKPARQRTAEYPVKVVQRGGIGGLRDTPKIIIGTGHSVKGGEADVVYLLPDLSPSGARNWEGKRADRDTVVRLAYVMMTRARESLIVCDPAGPEYMPIAAVASKVAAQAARRVIVAGTPVPVPDGLRLGPGSASSGSREEISDEARSRTS
jgi:superfamily I DNA/RNA helicase